MPNENELYRDWLAAPEDRRGDVETKLFSAVRKHAEAIVWEKLNDARPDLVQNIAGAVLTQLQDFRGDSDFSTWVHAIAKRKAYEELRRLGRERRVFDKNVEVVTDPHLELEPDAHVSEVVPSTAPDLEGRIAFAEFWEGLPEKDKALLRYKREGLNSKEIAERMGETVEAVDSRYARLKPKVKKEFRSTRRKTDASGN